MKEFRMSTAAERLAGVCFTAAVIACFGVLLYSLRSQTGLMIASGLGVLLLSALLVIYAVNVFKAAVVVDAGKKSLLVRGMKEYTVDVSKAVLLQTVAKKNGQSTVRVLVFSDENEQIVAVVPTMFTFRQGMWADPMARELAKELGIEFKQNVPDWEFDKEKYKEHVKEESEREKREARERRQKKMQKRIQKRKNQMK